MLKFIFTQICNYEKNYRQIFWGIVFLLAIAFSSFDSNSLISFSEIENSVVIEKNLSSVLNISPGGRLDLLPIRNFLIKIGLLGKRKKFNVKLQSRLEETFPDWEERLIYQMMQEKYYLSAMKKERDYHKIVPKGGNVNVFLSRNDNKCLNEKELDAVAYFRGTGFYAKIQDSTQPPSIFDTRTSFILKMHNKKWRMGFMLDDSKIKVYPDKQLNNIE